MTDPAYGKCYPFENVDQRAYEAQWRHLAGAWGDGIVNDFGGTSDGFAITSKSSSTRDITLALCEFRMRGIHFEPTTATLTLTVPAVAAGSTRADRVVAKFDPAAKSITFEIKTGTPVTSGTPAWPALTRNNGGVWELSLHVIQGGNVAASALTYVDQRAWLAPPVYVTAFDPASIAANEYPKGTRLFDASSGHTWTVSYPAGVATWTDLTSPAWRNLTIASGSGWSTLAGSTARARLVGDDVQVDGAVRSGSSIDSYGGAVLPASMIPNGVRRYLGGHRTSGGPSAGQAYDVLVAGKTAASPDTPGGIYITPTYADGDPVPSVIYPISGRFPLT